MTIPEIRAGANITREELARLESAPRKGKGIGKHGRRTTTTNSLSRPNIWLYEMWGIRENGEHVCLYVGKTDNWSRRRRSYAKEPYDPSRGAQALKRASYVVLNMAIDPELELIAELKPLYNIVR
jgi:hypothetical protein